MPKSVVAKSNFGHFQSPEQHSRLLQLISKVMTSYWCSTVTLGQSRTVVEL